MTINVDNRMSIDEYRRMMKLPPVVAVDSFGKVKQDLELDPCVVVATKPNKYGAIRTTYTSHLAGERDYPSELQADYAAELDRQHKAGLIRSWFPEIPLPLGARTETGRQRIIRVDFLIILADGMAAWRDTKGIMTDAWSLKRDLAQARYGIAIELVTRAMVPSRIAR